MAIRVSRFCLILAALAIMAACSSVSTDVGTAPPAIDQLKSRIEEATKCFQDITMVGAATYKDKKALSKVDPMFARLYDFKTATISLKMPDKLRMESKLGMVHVEYIINGGKKILRIPRLGTNKVDDYSNQPAKLQDALDVGLITCDLWRNRRVEVVDDADATANGEIKLRLRWPKGNIVYYAWIDAKDLWLKRFEKHGGENKLLLRIEYSNPKRVGEAIWIPCKAEMYAPNGEKAGASEYRDIKVNTGLADSLFE